jgi:hypothetical protein
MAIPVSHITAGAQGAALTRVRRVMPCSEHLLAHPQRLFDTLHQRGVILVPLAEMVCDSGNFVFHTPTLPAPHLRDYLCNNAVSWHKAVAFPTLCWAFGTVIGNPFSASLACPHTI